MFFFFSNDSKIAFLPYLKTLTIILQILKTIAYLNGASITILEPSTIYQQCHSYKISKVISEGNESIKHFNKAQYINSLSEIANQVVEAIQPILVMCKLCGKSCRICKKEKLKQKLL